MTAEEQPFAGNRDRYPTCLLAVGSLVADIISFDNKLTLRTQKQAVSQKMRRFEAFRKTLQSSCCVFKCEKCGTALQPVRESSESEIRKLRVPYRFCESCSSEYIDYIERLKGREGSDFSWQNAEWMDSWKRWIDYQWSVDRYLKSKEYQNLTAEIGPEE